MTQALVDTLLFVINLICTLFASIVLLRFLLQWVKADFYNPFCQFIMRLTNPLLLPLRRLIPGLFGLDLAALVLVFLILALNLALVSLFVGTAPTYVFLLRLLVKFIDLVLNLYFFVIVLRALMSFSPHAMVNPLFIVLVQLTEPILRPVRALIRPIHGFDLSPLVVIILIQALLFFLGKAVGVA
jgi:YggT family protein